MTVSRETLPAPQLECDDCMQAAAGLHHGFTAGCAGCTARAIARGPLFDAARRAVPGTVDGEQARDAYRAELEAGGVAHAQVIAARKLPA